MAVQVFKDGEEHYIDPQYLQGHLDAGYTLEPEESEAPTKEEADTNGSGKLSSEEVREAAKEANIEGWETKRIKTLKAELGYDE